VSGAVGAGVDVGLPTGAITPAVSGDELTAYYSLVNGFNKHDVYMATRATLADKFGAGVLIPSISTADEEYVSWVSADACQVWFASDRTTRGRTNAGDIYYVQKPL
jgi:hypothetical protein